MEQELRLKLKPCKGCKRGYEPFTARKDDLVLIFCQGMNDKENGCGTSWPRIPSEDVDRLEAFTIQWWNEINADGGQNE